MLGRLGYDLASMTYSPGRAQQAARSYGPRPWDEIGHHWFESFLNFVICLNISRNSYKLSKFIEISRNIIKIQTKFC
jgi:hypothetical protein